MTALGWGMAAAIGAVAGMLIAPVVFLEPNMMLGVLLYGFAGAVLGGLTSPGGAVLGGLGRHHRKPRRRFHSLCRTRAEADHRAGADRSRSDVPAERHLRAPGGQPGMTTVPKNPAAVAADAPAAARLAWRPAARHWVIAAAIVIALAILLAAKSFVVFQLTEVMIYGLAILGLNLLTGFNGQFSLGHSAFYGLGAYTAAILMHNYEVNYLLTLPAAGIVCFAIGFLFGLPALRLQNLYLALATFALAVAMPQILKFHALESWTGGVQGLVVDQPDPPAFLPIDTDQWLYYLTLAVVLLLFFAAANLVRSRSGRAIMAIRDNPIAAAAAMGVQPVAVQDADLRPPALSTPASPARSGRSPWRLSRPTASTSCCRCPSSSGWSSAASARSPAACSAGCSYSTSPTSPTASRPAWRERFTASSCSW